MDVSEGETEVRTSKLEDRHQKDEMSYLRRNNGRPGRSYDCDPCQKRTVIASTKLEEDVTDAEEAQPRPAALKACKDFGVEPKILK